MEFQKVTGFVSHIEEIYGIPNFDCSIYYKHQEVFRYRHGFADQAKTRPVGEDDLYILYSASKLSLVVSVMQLVEAGKLRLEDPISKYIPEILPITVKDGDGIKACETEPTIEQYLCMQGGLNYNVDREDLKEYLKGHPKASTQEIIRQFVQVPMDFVPGTRFQYSMCHDVLAAVVEIASGERYSDYVWNHIAKPVGMKELYFHKTKEIEDRLVQQYNYDQDSVHNIFRDRLIPLSNDNMFHLGDNYESAGAGIITRASDYVLLADALACDGVAATGNRILSRQSIDDMRTSRMDTKVKKLDYIKNTDFGYEYGLGVRTLVYDCTSKGPRGEFGWDGKGGVFFLSDVENQLSMFFAMSVTDMYPAKIVHHRLRDAMYEDFFSQTSPEK